MNKVVVEYTRTFGSAKEADTFCESLDAAGQDWYSCKASPGEYKVYVDHVKQLTAEEDTAEHLAWWARLDAALTRDEDQQKAKDRNVCVAIIRSQLAEKAAAESGQKGKAAQFFSLGFSGYPAKAAKPNEAGFAAEFRAGRAAWQSASWQRAFRAELAKRGI